MSQDEYIHIHVHANAVPYCYAEIEKKESHHTVPALCLETVHRQTQNISITIQAQRGPRHPKLIWSASPRPQPTTLCVILNHEQGSLSVKKGFTCSSWLLPSPGSPQMRTWMSPRTGTLYLSPACFLTPPINAKMMPAFTISWPWIVGQRAWTSSRNWKPSQACRSPQFSKFFHSSARLASTPSQTHSYGREVTVFDKTLAVISVVRIQRNDDISTAYLRGNTCVNL
jgi:hypothetical protein